MASTDVVLSIPDVANVPQDYDVPSAQEIVPKVVTASFGGSGAAGPYLPTVEILAPSGAVVCRAITSVAVAAGASADVSFFHLSASDEAAATASAYDVLIDNTPQILSHWTLNETSGTVFADSGPSQKPLPIIGTPTLGAAPLITTGHSAVFSGAVDGLGRATQYALSVGGYGAAPNNGSQTIEVWLTTTFSGATSPKIVCMDDNNFRYFQLFLTTTNKVGYVVFNNGGATSGALAGATTINDGVRHYIAATLDGLSLAMNVYVDGVLDGTLAATGAWTGTTPDVTLAARQVGGSVQTPIGGTLDEVALYSRALTAVEIANHYAAGIGA